MITIFSLDGIGGSGGPNAMCSNVWRPLVATGRYENVDVMYKASIGPANPQHNLFNNVWLRESSIDGAHKAAEAIHRTDNIAGVIGYSGGADAASQLAEDIARGADYTRDLEIAWIVTIANPRRQRQLGLPGFGIAGEHKSFPRNIQHREVANPDDVIPCAPEYSLLRFATDLGQEGPSWDWVDRANRNGYQIVIPHRWMDPRWWFSPGAFAQARNDAIALREGWFGAARGLHGYLTTAHGSEYWEKRLFDPVVNEILSWNL